MTNISWFQGFAAFLCHMWQWIEVWKEQTKDTVNGMFHCFVQFVETTNQENNGQIIDNKNS